MLQFLDFALKLKKTQGNISLRNLADITIMVNCNDIHFLIVKVCSLNRLMQSINEWKSEFNLHLGVKLLHLIVNPIKRER